MTDNGPFREIIRAQVSSRVHGRCIFKRAKPDAGCLIIDGSIAESQLLFLHELAVGIQ